MVKSTQGKGEVRKWVDRRKEKVRIEQREREKAIASERGWRETERRGRTRKRVRL